jgi:hypothetical protein
MAQQKPKTAGMTWAAKTDKEKPLFMNEAVS